MILAETDGVPHNTITPIARRRGAQENAAAGAGLRAVAGEAAE